MAGRDPKSNGEKIDKISIERRKFYIQSRLAGKPGLDADYSPDAYFDKVRVPLSAFALT